MSASSHPTIGCTFRSDEAAVDAIRALVLAETVADAHVGAVDAVRAAKIAQATGAAAGLDALDPLAGVAGLASGDDASAGVNTGAVVGGAVGAIAGIAAGSTSFGGLLPVDPSMRMLAGALLLFAVGIAVGGVLGGAFGRRPSTHAGFRLIDAMEAGDIAFIASVDASKIDEVRISLETAGANDVLVIDALLASSSSVGPG
jgi:hypothetical protein